MTALTPAERRAAVTALREWLATYSHGRRPDGYAGGGTGSVPTTFYWF